MVFLSGCDDMSTQEDMGIPGPVEIREMTADDLSEVLAIEHASFSAPWTEDHFREEMAVPFCHDLVIYCGGKLSGYMSFAIVHDEVHIRNIAVRRDVRRCGIASTLMGEMLSITARHRVRLAILEVRVSNVAAVRLYEKFGFSVRGVRQAYYTRPVEDALILCADLFENAGTFSSGDSSL